MKGMSSLTGSSPFGLARRRVGFDESVADVGAAAVRTIIAKPRNKGFYIYPGDSTVWTNPFEATKGSHEFLVDGALQLDARAGGREHVTVIDTGVDYNHPDLDDNMWINPDDPDLFVQSNDGGANVTRDGGQTWSTQQNQPTAELYDVMVDNQYPYRLYGSQQDNSTIMVPSNRPEESAPGGHTGYWMDRQVHDILYEDVLREFREG